MRGDSRPAPNLALRVECRRACQDCHGHQHCKRQQHRDEDPRPQFTAVPLKGRVCGGWQLGFLHAPILARNSKKRPLKVRIATFRRLCCPKEK